MSNARWIAFVVGALLIAGLAGAGGFVWGWVAATEPAKPPLLRELPGPWSEASAELRRRVASAHPVGSSEQTLISDLRRQGFRPSTWGDAEGKLEAELRQDTFVCNQAAYVRWTTDGNDRITSTDAVYREEGCL